MLSIILPSIRDISRFVTSIDASLMDTPYELVVVSPEFKDIPLSPLQKRAWCIEDKGSPARCLQRAVMECTGEIFTWGTDDGAYFPGKLKWCYERMLLANRKDGIIVKYTEEGPGTFTGACDEYYVAKYHDANRQPGIKPEWKTAPVGMFNTEYFIEMGGIDCCAHHLNMNVHNFCYRLQRDGGELYYSDGVVMHCDSVNWGPDHAVLDRAYENDLAWFKEVHKDFEWPLTIDYDNWRNSPEVWDRFR